MSEFNQGTIRANQYSIDIVAQDPGDIIAVFSPSSGGNGMAAVDLPKTVKIPLKSFKSDKSVDVTPVFGTGSHQAYQKTYGKVQYKGSFTINSWVSQTEKMKLERMLYSQDIFEGTPLEFDIAIYDRQNLGTDEAIETQGNVAGGYAAKPIVVCKFCTLTSSGIDIGEPGTPIATNYEFIALRRKPL